MKEKKWKKINMMAVQEGLSMCFIFSLCLGFVIGVISLLDLFSYPEFFFPEYIYSLGSFVWLGFTLSSSFGFTFEVAERQRYTYIIKIKLIEDSDERLREWLENEVSDNSAFYPKDWLFPYYSDIGFGYTGNLNSRTSFISAWFSLAVATTIILSAYCLIVWRHL